MTTRCLETCDAKSSGATRVAASSQPEAASGRLVALLWSGGVCVCVCARVCVRDTLPVSPHAVTWVVLMSSRGLTITNM